MRIGVVVPTYNQAQWLPGALVSVLSGGGHVVAINDGSTDTTQAILDTVPRDRNYFRAYRQDNAGTAAAINAGVARFHEDDYGWLSWCSSDNFMVDDWISPLYETAVDHGAGVAYGGFYYCAPDRVAYHFTPYDPDRLINDVNCYFGPAFLIRADVWREAGPHRGKISHDYDHWLRVEEVCWRRGLPIVGVDEPLCYYQAHDQRVTVTRKHEFDAHHWQAEARRRRASS